GWGGGESKGGSGRDSLRHPTDRQRGERVRTDRRTRVATFDDEHSEQGCSKCTDRSQIARVCMPIASQCPGKWRARRLPLRAAVTDSTVSARTRFDRFVAVSELPIAFLAVLVAPTLVVEGHARTAAVRDLAHAVNWMIWLTFCGAYTVKAVLTPDRGRHAGTLWLALLIVVLSMPVPLPGPFEWAPARLVVLMRFLRGAAVAAIGLRMRSHILRPNRLHYAFVMTAAIVGLGALG